MAFVKKANGETELFSSEKLERSLKMSGADGETISYAECSGLFLLGWDYPAGNGLRDIIDREKIYPITVLSSLNRAQKQILLDTGTVICRQVINDPKILDSLDLSINKKKQGHF